MDEDGSFILTLTSVSPDLATSTYAATPTTTGEEGNQPPHALASLDLCVVVAPRRDYPSFGTSVRGADECRLEVTCSGSPGGAAAALRTAAENTRLWGQHKGNQQEQSSKSSGSSSGSSGSTSTIPLFSGTVGDAAGAVLRGAAGALESAYQRRLLALLTIDLKATAESLAVAPAFVFAPSRPLRMNTASAKKHSSSLAHITQGSLSATASERTSPESQTMSASTAAAAAAATTNSPREVAPSTDQGHTGSGGSTDSGHASKGSTVGVESKDHSHQRPSAAFDGGAWMLAAALAPLATGSLGSSSSSGKGTASAHLPPLFPTPRPPGFFFGDRTVSSVESNGCELSAAGFTCVGSDDGLSDGGADTVDDDDDDEDVDEDDEDDEEDDIEGISDAEQLGAGDDSDEDSDDDEEDDDDDVDEAMAAIEAEVLLAEADEKDDQEGGSSSCGDSGRRNGGASVQKGPKMVASEDDDEEDEDSDSELEGGLGVEDEALAMVRAVPRKTEYLIDSSLL